MAKYVGIADCYGIESFLPLEENREKIIYLQLRAMANRHRHAVVYIVELTDENAKLINKCLDKGNYEKALHLLKSLANDVSFPKRDADSYSNSWMLIPNPRLDPYSR